jgi:hypothetical protein
LQLPAKEFNSGSLEQIGGVSADAPSLCAILQIIRGPRWSAVPIHCSPLNVKVVGANKRSGAAAAMERDIDVHAPLKPD